MRISGLTKRQLKQLKQLADGASIDALGPAPIEWPEPGTAAEPGKPAAPEEPGKGAGKAPAAVEEATLFEGVRPRASRREAERIVQQMRKSGLSKEALKESVEKLGATKPGGGGHPTLSKIKEAIARDPKDTGSGTTIELWERLP